jgi:hypothetical protein
MSEVNVQRVQYTALAWIASRFESHFVEAVWGWRDDWELVGRWCAVTSQVGDLKRAGSI